MTNSTKTTAQAFFEHVYAGRTDDALALLGDDAEYTVRGPREFPLAGTYRKAELGNLFKVIGTAVPNGVSATITSTVAEGDVAVVMGHVEAMPASGRPYANDFVFVTEVRDNHIIRIDEYIDTMHANDALFGAPTAPQLTAEDEAEVRKVVLGYVSALDSRQFSHIADAFTADAELENVLEEYLPESTSFAGVMTGGASAIAGSVGQLMSALDATQHFLGAMWIEPTDTGARVRTQVIAHHHRGDGFYHTGGTYLDSFVRTGDGWRIARRTLHTTWTTGDAQVILAAG